MTFGLMKGKMLTKRSVSVSTAICQSYCFKIQLSKKSKTFYDTCSHKSIFIKLQFIFSVRIKLDLNIVSNILFLLSNMRVYIENRKSSIKVCSPLAQPKYFVSMRISCIFYRKYANGMIGQGWWWGSAGA